MARNQTMFYATGADMRDVLAALEAMQEFQYTRTGLFPSAEPMTVRSFKDIPDLGVTTRPNAIGSPAYLMSLRGETVSVEPTPQKAGGVLYSVGQRLNQNTVHLRPGGRYEDRVILNGTLGTVATSEHSLMLYRIVSKVLRQKFSPVEEYLVGPDAMQAWKAGARLTIAVQSPPEFDLGARSAT